MKLVRKKQVNCFLTLRCKEMGLKIVCCITIPSSSLKMASKQYFIFSSNIENKEKKIKYLTALFILMGGSEIYMGIDNRGWVKINKGEEGH